MSQAILQVRDISLTVNDIEVIYDGAILAVAGVSLSVPKGAIVALLGANGAGKSTTLKAISGLVRAERAEVSRGVIEYAGHDLAGVDPSQRVRQGMVHVLEGRHRPGVDDPSYFGTARRAVHGFGAYDRAGDIRDRRAAQPRAAGELPDRRAEHQRRAQLCVPGLRAGYWPRGLERQRR